MIKTPQPQGLEPLEAMNAKVLPVAPRPVRTGLRTAYAVSETFGVPKRVSLDFRRGKVFFSLLRL